MMTVIIWFCATVFACIGIYAGRQEVPMSFYSGTTIDPDDCKDIIAYNNEIKGLWLIFSIPFWITGFVGLFSVGVAGVMVALASITGLIWLPLRYGNIATKYLINQ